MKYVSAKTASEMWGISKRRVLVLCKERRIPGAQLIGNSWIIPAETIKPVDGRSTRYQSSKIAKSEILPIQYSVKAKRHTAQYLMHKYFARRPYNVFQHLIKHYSNKGDIILDCFSGGGVTVFEAASIGRKVIGVDINPLATFITRMQMFNGDIEELHNFYNSFLHDIEEKYKEWYSLSFDDDHGVSIWTEWVYVVKCPKCDYDIKLLEKNKISNGIYRCPNKNCEAHLEGIKRVLCVPNGSYPVRANYKSSVTKKILTRNITLDNIPALKSINFEQILNELLYKPEFKIPKNWDRQHEDKLKEKGVTNYSDFFTKRNYTLNCLIFNKIMLMREKTDSHLNEYLYFLFSSSLRYTNKMTRVTDNWEGGKPTSMDKHAFWLPNQYVETNILDVLSNRVKSLLKGCEYSSQKMPSNIVEVKNFEDLRLYNSYLVLNQSASNLPIPDKSIDVIITDPPYGSNVQYAELSTIWNAWYAIYNKLDNYIFNDEEAIMNRKTQFEGSKTINDYEELLYMVYSESARTLKDDGYLVFTFNNKNIKVWIAMLKAVARAGFYLPENGIIFQNYIKSYQNTAHLRFSGNIQGDFIYSFRKGKAPVEIDGTKGIVTIINDSIKTTIQNLFKKRETYTTPELYQNILTAMTNKLMQYIQWCLNTNSLIEDTSSLGNTYLEDQLKKILVCENGIWRKSND